MVMRSCFPLGRDRQDSEDLCCLQGSGFIVVLDRDCSVRGRKSDTNVAAMKVLDRCKQENSVGLSSRRDI